MAGALLLLALPLGVLSQSATSCGAASDHLKDVKITLSPDPVQKGKPVTITFSGNLDAVQSAMNVDIDLNIKALGIINEPVKLSSPFSITPGLQAGPMSVAVGPLTIPNLPGTIEADGTIKLTNDKKEAVSCIKLAFKYGADTEVVAPAVQGSNVSICSKAADHLHNLAYSENAGVTTITGALDEVITKLDIDVDLKLVVGPLKIPFPLKVPISYTPGLQKGDLKITAGPSSKKLPIDVDVTGTVKANDGNSEEIFCLSFAPASKVITV